MTCVGCGAAGAPAFVGKVPACAKCGDLFLAIFGRDTIPREGLIIPEGPITRIADAILVEMGLPSAKQAAAPMSPLAWRDVRMRTPRRGKLRR